MRDAKLEEIEEGTSDIQRLIISRRLLGLIEGSRLCRATFVRSSTHARLRSSARPTIRSNGATGSPAARSAAPLAATSTSSTEAAARSWVNPRSARSASSPTRPELVVVAVPARRFEEAVDGALAAGRPGDRRHHRRPRREGRGGRAREQTVVASRPGSGAVLLGPNCLGVFDAGPSWTSAGATLPPGEIGLISQSGNLALELALIASGTASASPASPRSATRPTSRPPSWSRAFAEHEPTRVIALYVEDFRDGRAFARGLPGGDGPESRSSCSLQAAATPQPRRPLAHGRARERLRRCPGRLPGRGHRAGVHADRADRRRPGAARCDRPGAGAASSSSATAEATV